jgi:triosephosphate isomerase
MHLTQRRPLIVANWKMHKTLAEATHFISELALRVANSTVEIYIASPYTALHVVANGCLSTKLIVGAQNMNENDQGAFTGEISGRMLLDAGAKFVILGHSERRSLYGESNELVNKKLKKALEINLKPILCIGETAEERERGDTVKILTNQLRYSLLDLSPEEVFNLTLAYEPVWAIGTQQTATPDVAQEVHAFCREYFMQEYGADIGHKIRILYGGSVKPDNAAKLMEEKDIDGLLVGSASLSADSFEKIVNYSKVGK